MLEDGVEQRGHVRAPLLAGRALFQRRPAVDARGVDHREVELLVGGAELVEQVERGVDDIVGLAPGLSTLLTTTMGLRPRASAFLVTKRVCGIGPSWASISSTTPSTMDSARSTSPPKSAWPGVSTMLMWVPSQLTAQFLARMVMPRSRSMALLSITVSTTFSWSAKVPDWRSSWSTMVVLPWSTWAMMAMLRICLSCSWFSFGLRICWFSGGSEFGPARGSAVRSGSGARESVRRRRCGPGAAQEGAPAAGHKTARAAFGHSPRRRTPLRKRLPASSRPA
jgi:hypothetical protein